MTEKELISLPYTKYPNLGGNSNVLGTCVTNEGVAIAFPAKGGGVVAYFYLFEKMAVGAKEALLSALNRGEGVNALLKSRNSRDNYPIACKAESEEGVEIVDTPVLTDVRRFRPF